MWSLFRKKKEPTLPDSMVKRLNEIDTEYMKAYSTKSIRKLQEYVTRDCALKIRQAIWMFNGERYFGAPKFRKTLWSVLSQEGDTVTLQKEVHFDSVRVGSIVNIGVADDYKEKWTLDVTAGGCLVLDISII